MTAPRVEGQLRAIAGDLSTELRKWLATFREDPRLRRRVGRRLVYLLVALLPIHAGLVAVGVPSWWKELVIAVTLFIALTLPARARPERVDLLVALYFALVVASAIVNRVTNVADLSPYFVYVPLAVILPRLLVTSDEVALLVWIGVVSLLFNLAWMVALRLHLIDVPDLLSVAGPRWNVTGSLTGGALATATIYGVSAGTAWVAGAISRRYVGCALLGVAFTAAGAMSGSRAALIGSGAGLVVAIALTAGRMRSRPVNVRLLIGISVCLVIAAIVAGPHLLRADDALRASRWQAAIHLALEHPLLGAGPGATSQARAIRDLGLSSNSPLADNLVGTRVSESTLLKLLAEIGMPGFAAIAIWVLSILIRAGIRRPLKLTGRDLVFLGPAMVVLTVVNGISYQNMESFVGASMFWLGIGLCRGKWSAAQEHSSGRIAPNVATI